MSTPRYSFDTSSFLNGRRDLFRPRVFTSLWSNIEEAIANGRIRSVDLVRDELARHEGDEIHQWAMAQSGLFLPLSIEVQEATRSILAAHPRLVGVGGRRSGADPFVIALAMVHGGMVVTEELASNNIDKPRIPDVCEAIGVLWLNLMGFIEEQGWTF